jgi:hypothetical protein
LYGFTEGIQAKLIVEKVCARYNVVDDILGRLNPLVLSAFLGQILLKLAGNAYNGKNDFPLFCFSFKMNMIKDICVQQFQDFFNSAHFLSLKVDKKFTRLSLEHKELGSVEIFRLTLMVLEI